MNKTELNQAGRASTANLKALAAEGVQRALAVRMTELSAAQVQDVSGAATLASTVAFDEYCGTGVRPIPKVGTVGGVGGGVIVIINGQYPNLNQAALGAKLTQTAVLR